MIAFHNLTGPNLNILIDGDTKPNDKIHASLIFLLGWIYDITQEYQFSFYIGGAAIHISGLIMILPSCHKIPEDDVMPTNNDADCMDASRAMTNSTTSVSH